ncbi:HD domain-containing protein [Ruminiclostridium papyrosolvens DSM 2782]|nr:HD domain-containing protein [Ruminiclostridium papyrosolvens]WES35957.1 HD domain-containing protein [Ruminiclostridium papyrosolvens DSM 2782]
MDCNRALEYATNKHKGQKRIGGDEYISHPVAVSNILKDLGYSSDVQIAGLFHDLLEDTDAAKEEILELSNAEVLEVVTLLTKEEGYDMNQYMIRIRANEIALVVKLADRLHNLICAVYADEKFKKKYIVETQKYYIDLAAGTSFENPIKRALQGLIDSVEKEKV